MKKQLAAARRPCRIEYIWGTTSIQQATGVSGTEDGTETALPAAANCQFGNTTISGGDGGGGLLRAGIFAKAGNSREQSGASFWGIMDLGGSAQELCYSVGVAAARAFAGAHGNGVLTATGASDVADLPFLNSSEVIWEVIRPFQPALLR